MQYQNTLLGKSLTKHKNYGTERYKKYTSIVGHLRRKCSGEIFPLGEDGKEADELQGQSTNTLTARYEGAQATGSYIVEDKLDEKNVAFGQLNNPKHSNNRVFDVKGISPALNTMQGGNRQPKIAMPKIAGTLTGGGHSGGLHSDMTAIPVLTPDRSEKRQNGRRFKEDGEPMFTLTGQDKHGVLLGHSRDKKGTATYHEVDIAGTLKQPSGNQCNYLKNGMRIRRLTPTECERLQGFPDGWTKYGLFGGKKTEISDTQRYKMAGNAVTVSVISAIAKKLLEDLK